MGRKRPSDSSLVAAVPIAGIAVPTSPLPAPLILGLEAAGGFSPDKFVIEVVSELSQELLQRRWRDVNVVLRLSMLSGLRMELNAMLNVLCDFASEIVSLDCALGYFWEESEEQVRLQVLRGFDAMPPDPI